MSRYIKNFLNPTHYISKEDDQLKASVQMISDHKQKGGLNGHVLAISQAVRSIALALLVNTPFLRGIQIFKNDNMRAQGINNNQYHPIATGSIIKRIKKKTRPVFNG